MSSRGWTCRKCKRLNEPSHRVCRTETCDGRKRPKRVPNHARVLQSMTRADFAALNVTIHGGTVDHCPCCGRRLVEDGMNQREHDHRTGWARGLTCWHCNHQLLRNHTVQTLRDCLAYLERVEAYYRDANDAAAV